MSIARQILEAARVAILGLNGPPGGYIHDLEGRVYMGDPSAAAVDGPLPAVWLTGWTIDARDDDQLGAFRRIVQLQVVGVVGAEADDPAERMLAATDLLGDIARALELRRSLRDGDGPHVVRMLIRGQAVDGGMLGAVHAGICEAVVELEYITPSEAGF